MFVMQPLNPMEAVRADEAATPALELVCPAGSLPALKAAVDHGANCVYLGLRDATNARNFAGLNFDEAAIAQGIDHAHARGCKVFMALNTYPQAANPGPWRSALDKAVDARAGASGADEATQKNSLKAKLSNIAATAQVKRDYVDKFAAVLWIATREMPKDYIAKLTGRSVTYRPPQDKTGAANQ